MLVRVLALGAAVTGCTFTAGGGGGGGGGSDARPADALHGEGIVPTIDAPYCAAGLIDVCFVPPPPPTLALANEAINTGTDPRCLASETEGCVMAARAITVGGIVTAIGARPLILVAETTIIVDGTLDVSSTRGGTTGAGANSTACSVAGAGIMGSSGASGAAGGSFGDKGGDGGLGDNNGQKHPGGLAGAAQPVIAVRGGCAGGTGGFGTAAGGAGGAGGGGVYLSAGVSITVESVGAVYASGAGAGGGLYQEAGGGGGGSGGLVGLAAPTVTIDGIVAANGGGGGGGSAIQNNANGGPGADGTRVTWNVVALGGVASRFDSGTGGTGTGGAVTVGQTPVAVDGGGGGGGGGAGVIWVKGALTGTTISPAPQLQ